MSEKAPVGRMQLGFSDIRAVIKHAMRHDSPTPADGVAYVLGALVAVESVIQDMLKNGFLKAEAPAAMRLRAQRMGAQVVDEAYELKKEWDTEPITKDGSLGKAIIKGVVDGE
jgi:hypothetical protein